LCLAYPGLNPLVIEDMTLDQVNILRGADSPSRRYVTGTPQSLAARGLIPPQPARSVAQMMADGMTEEEIFGTPAASQTLTKRQRRKARMAARQEK